MRTRFARIAVDSDIANMIVQSSATSQLTSFVVFVVVRDTWLVTVKLTKTQMHRWSRLRTNRGSIQSMLT